jgi:hypothetical protein
MSITRDSLAQFTSLYNQYYPGTTTSGPTQASAITNLQRTLDSWNTAVRASLSKSQADITIVSQKAALLAELNQELKDLKSKQITRDQQAVSVNPKITQSPYVNILGLRRNFRYNTRVGLIVASVTFGVLALGVLGYYISTVGQGFMKESPILVQSGGRKSSPGSQGSQGSQGITKNSYT